MRFFWGGDIYAKKKLGNFHNFSVAIFTILFLQPFTMHPAPCWDQVRLSSLVNKQVGEKVQCLCKILIASVKYMLNFRLFLLKMVYCHNDALFWGAFMQFFCEQFSQFFSCNFHHLIFATLHPAPCTLLPATCVTLMCHTVSSSALVQCCLHCLQPRV